MSTTDNPNDNTTRNDTTGIEMTTNDMTPLESAPDEDIRHPSAPQDDQRAGEGSGGTTREPAATAGQPTTAWPETSAPAAVTTAAPTAATASAGTSGTATGRAPTTAATAVPTKAPDDGPWLEGPAPFAIVLGLLGLLVAGGVLVSELTDLTFPWADLGPWTVVAAGLVIVLVGAIGLRSSRRTQG